MLPRPQRSPLFPYTTLFRSQLDRQVGAGRMGDQEPGANVGIAIEEDSSQAAAQPIEQAAPDRGIVQHRQGRSEEHTSELQSHHDLVCRLLLEKKKKKNIISN